MKEQRLTNMNYLNELTGGDKDFEKEMIRLFFSQVDEFTVDLENYLHNEQYAELGELAHKAKSSVMVFGLDELGHRLKELQLKTQKLEDVASYAAYVDEFKKTTEKAVEELSQLL